MHVREGDIVMVIAGDDKGSHGKVLKMDRAAGKVTVEGMNRVYKHVRRSQRNPQGGRLSLEMPIDISNVMLICEATGKPSRTGVRYLEDGSKERFCKKSGTGAGQIAPPKVRYAKKMNQQ